MLDPNNLLNNLFDAIERFKKAEADANQEIEKALGAIKLCLKNIKENLERGESPSNEKLAEIEKYAKNLFDILRGSIKRDEIDELAGQLAVILRSPLDKHEGIKNIDNAVGAINYHMRVRKPLDTGRRNLLLGILGMASAGAAGWIIGPPKNPPSASQTTTRLVNSPKEPTITWKMASIFEQYLRKDSALSKKDIILFKVPHRISERIKNITEGDFIIEIDENTEWRTEDILSGVNRGEIQCGYSGIFYEDYRYYPLFFGCAIPFGLSPQEQTAWLSYKEHPNDEFTFVQKIYKKLYESHGSGLEVENVIPFAVAGTGRQMGGWFKKKIMSTSDFSDLRMRIPGLGGEVFSELGAKIKSKTRLDKLRKELKDGKLQAAEWTGLHDDFELGLHEVAKYYYSPSWWETSLTLDMQVSEKAWDKLPKAYQKVFKAACQESYTNTIAEYDQKNSSAYRKIDTMRTEENEKLELERFGDDVIRSCKEKTREVLKNHVKDDPVFEDVYARWKEFTRDMRRWSNFNSISSPQWDLFSDK